MNLLGGCVSNLSCYHGKMPDIGDLRKGWFILASSLRVQSITTGKPQKLELQATLTVRKQTVLGYHINWISVLFSPGSQAIEWVLCTVRVGLVLMNLILTVPYRHIQKLTYNLGNSL